MEKKENENVTKRMNSGMFKHAVCVCAPGGAIAGIFIGFRIMSQDSVMVLHGSMC